jgi:uncharacterized protein (TIRG00374 family)
LILKNQPISEPPDNDTTGALSSKQRRPNFLAILSFGFAGFLLFLTLRGLDWTSFWRILGQGHYFILLFTLPIGSLSYFIRAARWSTLLRLEKQISILSVFWANMAGYLGNLLLPARAGELVRSAFLARKSGASTSYMLATALIERLLDALALVLIGAIALLRQTDMPDSILNAMKIMAVAGILGLLTFIIVPSQEVLLLRILGKLPLSAAFAPRVSVQIRSFMAGMRSLRDTRRLLRFLLLTGLIWFLDGIATVVGVRVISQTLDLSQALILISALGLSSAIPSTPGYIGVYQFVAVFVLVPFGFTKAEALAYILISQILGYIVVMAWGLLGLWRLNHAT